MTEPRTPEQIETEIEAQREQLAQTVDQLTAKLDVKSRARSSLADAMDRATTEDGKPRPAVIAAAVSLVATVTVVVIWRLRHPR